MADEDSYHFLLENTVDILWTIDLDGRWQFITRNVEKIMHLKPSDIVGKTIWDFLAPESLPVVREKLKERIRGEDIAPYEVIIIDGRGERVPFEVVTSPIRDREGDIIGVQGISRDIAKRKCAEESARKSEAKFRDLVENTYDWVWEADREFVLTYSNPRVRDYLGYAPAEITGKSLYDLMAPGFAERIAARLKDMVRQHRKYDVAEKTMVSKGGELVPFEMTLSLMFAGDGTFEGYRGICRDIRDRKRAEDARRKAYAGLEKRIEERTAELEEAKARAELYLDLMSHDINNMNMVAMGKIEMLRTAVGPGSPGAALLDGALDMLQSSTQLIENVRKLQQAESGGLEAGIVDLCSVVENVGKKYAEVPGRVIRINVRYPQTGNCMVRANRLVDDIFSNLVDNAIKHSAPDKPIEIDIDLSRTREGGREYYRTVVEDNGPGIPEELKAKLFTRLGRGKVRVSGRGLGLYLVKKLVDGFGGKVWAEDRTPGDFRKGTRFVVLLPATPAPPAAGAGTSSA